MRRLQLGMLVVAGLLGGTGAVAAETVEVGIFLPTVITDGQERLRVVEKLAQQLQQDLGIPVTGRSFGRFQDFSEALASGAISLGVVDGWAAGQLPASVTPVAVGRVGGDRHRLQLVSKTRRSVPSLQGATLAVVRGAPGTEGKLTTQLFFSGDLQAPQHFKLVPVPNVESAREALDAGGAEVAILPAGSSTGLEVLYTGPQLPAALVVMGKKRLPPGMREALLKTTLAPLERFLPAQGEELASLRVLAQRGPPRRVPMMAESPTQRFELDLVDLNRLELQLPPLSSTAALPQETPDD